jgi:hypothetical protein
MNKNNFNYLNLKEDEKQRISFHYIYVEGTPIEDENKHSTVGDLLISAHQTDYSLFNGFYKPISKPFLLTDDEFENL